ncbi:permease [Terrisporobacter sp.]|uniref:permease n=1 Tax=Terrisporobacter sp. TaxID=1965305 RepID=UPI00260FCA42|nr:permease [Terrisporobacter sp.]
MTSYILYGLCIFSLIISYIKNKEKTKIAIKKGLSSFENIMPQFFTIIIVIGILLSIIDTDTISKIIGSNSGFLGVLLASVAGSITLMPTFVAFSMANSLLISGAGYAQVAALVSTLTMVGVMTFSLEAKYMGKNIALIRNILAFLFSFIVALFVEAVFSIWT